MAMLTFKHSYKTFSGRKEIAKTVAGMYQSTGHKENVKCRTAVSLLWGMNGFAKVTFNQQMTTVDFQFLVDIFNMRLHRFQ